MDQAHKSNIKQTLCVLSHSGAATPSWTCAAAPPEFTGAMLIFRLTVTFLSPGQFFSTQTHGGPHCAHISPSPPLHTHSRDSSSSPTPFLYLLFSLSFWIQERRALGPGPAAAGRRGAADPAAGGCAGRAGGVGEARRGGSGGGEVRGAGRRRRGGAARRIRRRGGPAPRSAAASRLLFFAKIFQHLFF